MDSNQNNQKIEEKSDSETKSKPDEEKKSLLREKIIEALDPEDLPI